jgi:hypothetical protein
MRRKKKKEPVETDNFEALIHQQSALQYGFPCQMKIPTNYEGFIKFISSIKEYIKENILFSVFKVTNTTLQMGNKKAIPDLGIQ